LHYQIGYDHPFCDGNGRTARALFYWQMLRSGYWLFEYLPISRLIYKGPAKYGKSFLYVETDESDITYSLMYMAGIVTRARHDLKEFLSRKQREISDARSLLAKDLDLNHRQRDILIRALRNPDRIFTIAEHQRVAKVAYGTANVDLQTLADRGYLQRFKSGNRYEYRRGDRLDEAIHRV
jgi:Fic family protein